MSVDIMRRLAGSLLLAVIASTAQAQAPPSAESMAPRIEHSLKRAVRVIGIADSAFSLADRMKYWHVLGDLTARPDCCHRRR